MQDLCETDNLESSLNLLRTAPAGGKKSAAFQFIKNAPKDEVGAAWHKVRATEPEAGWESDCLQRVAVLPPNEPIECERALVLVLGPGFEQMCEWLVETFLSFGASPEARIVIFCIDSAYRRLQSLEKRVPQVTLVRCRSVEKITPAVKGVIYSLARWVKAETIIALECDILITGSLQPLWSAIEAAPANALLGCNPNIIPGNYSLRSVGEEITRYGSSVADLSWMTGIDDCDSEVCFNGGMLAGNHAAWRELDGIIRSWMPYCALWMEGFRKPYGDEMIMNLAVGQMSDRVTLPQGWNVQSFTAYRPVWFITQRTSEGVSYRHPRGETAHILHFAGGARPVMRDVFYELALNALAQRKRQRAALLTD